MSTEELKERDEFLATFEAAFPYLNDGDKRLLVAMARRWSSKEKQRQPKELIIATLMQ